MKKALIIISIIAIIIIAGSLLYYFVFYKTEIFNKTYYRIEVINYSDVSDKDKDTLIKMGWKWVIADDIDIYKAKKILRITNSTIRFIDLEGFEHFITADEINYHEYPLE